MITLITGLPGNGKTLFALWFIKMMAEKEGREVFYHNIKDLNLPWTEFDPKKWMDLPYGAIIVIDEAQDIFPKMPNGAKLPDYYTELAKHRHKGFDIFPITQHPSLLDNFVRQLVGRHFHVIRKFGLQRATVYEWSSAQNLPQNPSAQKSSVTMKWGYPKEVYTYYKSAEVHTVKRSIPMKLILAVLFVVAVPTAIYYALHAYQARGKGDNAVAGRVAPNALGVAVAGGGAGAVFDPVADSRLWLQRATPRVVGLPQTAPKYDEMTKPTHVPIPAACIQHHGDKCKCFTQQGTAMDVPLNLCIGFAREGFFQEFDADRDRQPQVVTDRGAAALAASPVGKAVEPSQVLSFGYEPPPSRSAPVALPGASGGHPGRVSGQSTGSAAAGAQDVGRL